MRKELIVANEAFAAVFASCTFGIKPIFWNFSDALRKKIYDRADDMAKEFELVPVYFGTELYVFDGKIRDLGRR